MTTADRILLRVQRTIHQHEEHSLAIIRRFGESEGKITTQMLLDALEEQRKRTVQLIQEIVADAENT